MKPTVRLLSPRLRLAAMAAFTLACVMSAVADLQLLSVPGQPQAPSATATGDSYLPIVSADGRFVLFASAANNLTPNSSNMIALSPLPMKMNVYRRDRTNATTTLSA